MRHDQADVAVGARAGLGGTRLGHPRIRHDIALGHPLQRPRLFDQQLQAPAHRGFRQAHRLGKRGGPHRMVRIEDGRKQHQIQPVAMDGPIAVDRRQHHVDRRRNPDLRIIGLGGGPGAAPLAELFQPLDEADETVVRQSHHRGDVGPLQHLGAHQHAILPAHAQTRLGQRDDVAAYRFERARQRDGERMRGYRLAARIAAQTFAHDQREDGEAVDVAFEAAQAGRVDPRLHLCQQECHFADVRRHWSTTPRSPRLANDRYAGKSVAFWTYLAPK
ncbi:hypothetical protein WR25_10155 [Diploscapter pachys]|uniref:Uncharacterized protein n=1 Tax=Diploscapter pachys TaxID=2018661 RepID=A0A2A2K1U3_9BILA|nr:hypothetical protein WR25_10155 [Diploscapter pachys]